jgi:Leucine-rich repeat (LRR) protein
MNSAMKWFGMIFMKCARRRRGADQQSRLPHASWAISAPRMTIRITLLLAAILTPVARAADPKPAPSELAWLGQPQGATAIDTIAADAPLVGMDVWVGIRLLAKPTPTITAIAPIYGGPNPRRTGPYGLADALPIRVEAEEGYAVAGLVGRASDRIEGLRLVFMRLRDGKLDPHDRYESRWIGGRGSGNLDVRMAGDGKPIVGMIYRFEGMLNAFALVKDAKQLIQPREQFAQAIPTERIVQEVERRDGSVVRDMLDPAHSIVEIDLRGLELRDADLAILHGLTSLKRLDLSQGYHRFTGAGLAHLESLTNLEEISIQGNFGNIPRLPLYVRNLSHLKSLDLNSANNSNQDSYAPILGSMTGLEKLTLSDSYNDAAMDHLGRLTNLRELLMNDTAMTDDGAARLQNLRQLRSLTVYTNFVGDDGFASLEGLRELEQLTLGGGGPTAAISRHVALTSAVLKHVHAPKLRSLTLRGSQFDDGVVPYLDRMETLEELHLVGTQLSDKGLAELNQLKHLTTLDLAYGSLTGVGLKGLTDLKNLSTLKLARNPIEGQSLAALKNFPAVKVLDLANTQVTAASLENLKHLTKLRELSLSGVPLGDESLARLGALPALEMLELPGTKINGSGLPYLKSLKNLEQINLRGNPITEENANVLGDLNSLRKLALDQTAIGDATVAALSKLPKLEFLSIGRTQVTDSGVKSLESATKLRELDASNSRLTGAIVAPILAMRELRTLRLNMTQITDSEFERLAELPHLRRLDINMTRISDNAIRNVQQKSLHINIFRNYPGFPNHRP